MLATQPAIQADGLRKSYGRIQALDGVDLAVPPGTIFGLLGPNGAGKSTTVRILTTLSTPDAGTARVAGFDVKRQAGQVRRAIGVVSQRSGVDKALTGRENLLLQGAVFGMGGRALRERVDQLFAMLGLADAADRIVRTYSGGMQRRLDVGIGLVHRPSVLFLDEPTTGLDPEVRAAMWGEISRLADDGLTILLTTHYLEEADHLAGRIAIMERGRVVAEGTPDALKRELRGDALQLELTEPPVDGTVSRALEPILGVREVSVDGRAVRARADDGARAVPAVLQALEARGVGVAAVRIARPSLDDVYLRHTGRTFADAERAPSPAPVPVAAG
jgi:ABC-2 type transport system ATP-binding protein